MSAGRRRAEMPSRPTPLLAAPSLAGGVVAAAAWLALVVAAVRLGQASRWVPAVAVTVAAVGCLLLVFALLSRTWSVLFHGPPSRAGSRRRTHRTG
jgi:tellurite resistance protein TehA-like permease